MTPDDVRHGSTAGYDAHRRADQTPCESCRRAAALNENIRRSERARGHRRTVPAVGTARRVQALVALGYTFRQIAEPLGVSHDMPRKWAMREGIVRTSVATRVDGLFRALCMTPAPTGTRVEKWSSSYARSVALRHGWLPPLAWDDIDDPDETPAGGRDVLDHDAVDPVVVERFLSGDWGIPTTKAEKFAITARWTAWGRSLHDLERATGWRAERYVTRQDGAA